MYERGLILLHEGEQMEGAKDNELYQYIKAAEGSARQRLVRTFIIHTIFRF